MQLLRQIVICDTFRLNSFPKKIKKYIKIYIYIYIYKYIFEMCISLTEADAIHILMQSQRYNTLKIHMKQIAIRDYTKLKLNFNCNKKHTLTHLSLVVMTVLDYIVFTHYNSPFTVTAIIKCKFDSELLCSVCLASILAATHPKWIYLHDFLTFTDTKKYL